MLKGIKLSYGVIFVTDGELTLRYKKDRGWEASPVLYFVLEHELSTEPPETWEYISESDLRALPDNAYDKMLLEFERLHRLLND